MARKNQYAKRARISEAKIREIVRYVAADLTALQAAALSGLNRNTVNRLYRGVRERRLLACEAQRRLFGVVEVDERFFGARRVKGRRGRGAYGKTVVFGIFARQGHVYTEIVPDCSKPQAVVESGTTLRLRRRAGLVLPDERINATLQRRRKLLEGHVSSESSLYSPLPVNGTSARVILTRTIQHVIVVLDQHGYD